MNQRPIDANSLRSKLYKLIEAPNYHDVPTLIDVVLMINDEPTLGHATEAENERLKKTGCIGKNK